MRGELETPREDRAALAPCAAEDRRGERRGRRRRTPRIGEPDIAPHRDGSAVTLEIRGLGIYDLIKDEVKARDLHDINYWMVDDDYDGSHFVVRQVFFCGGDEDEFAGWRKGPSDLAKQTTRTRAEKALKIEIDEEAFGRIYGFRSHPIRLTRNGQKIAVRIVSQFGEESTKVFTMSP